jgi:hypothetical protein
MPGVATDKNTPSVVPVLSKLWTWPGPTPATDRPQLFKLRAVPLFDCLGALPSIQ